ncbi:MAG: hypothetical protein ABW075_08735 [Aeromicrobium sp.]
MPPLELSFASDVRFVRRIGLGMLLLGLVALGWTLLGDPTSGGNGSSGLVAGWVGAIVAGGLGAVCLWSLRNAGSSALRIDATGITSTTGRGTVLVTWEELAAVDVWVSVRTGLRNHVIDPRALRTRIRILVRLAPTNPDFGSRPDLRPLRRVLGPPPFTRVIGVPPPAFTTGESLPEVDQIAAALTAFAGDRFHGVSR